MQKKNLIKLECGIGKRLKKQDKREVIRKKDNKRTRKEDNKTTRQQEGKCRTFVHGSMHLAK